MKLVIYFLIPIFFYVILVFIANRRFKVVVKTRILIQNNKYDVEIIRYSNEVKDLYALALLYAVKIRWLLLSEPVVIRQLFDEVLKEIIENWPIIKEVKPSINAVNGSLFEINLCRYKNTYSLTNTLPPQFQLQSYDLAAHYFYLLKTIVEKLNPAEKNKLKNLFSSSIQDITTLEDESVLALNKITKKINSTINELSV